MFNIHFCAVLFFAAFIVLILTEELGIHNTILPLPPFKKLEELLELCSTVNGKQVLFNILVCKIISKKTAYAMIWFGFCSRIGHLMPIFLWKRGKFLKFGLFIAHININKPALNIILFSSQYEHRKDSSIYYMNNL